ncbi:hypothetical protein FEM48_Zijuj01G0230600 [Ziziphus jujuba var. spinosa]|uniref:Reactive Intermediate Deaminase A, chloroplastic n=1 Tax=Ziziphus jujuba var. spinosa TaxID=714518 RepID=A0A978W427_ZIZJJ|nr:hypothetical protein FEM48_Zijuj01G0230600 [Ziziphus jujuba var. spinosa]
MAWCAARTFNVPAIDVGALRTRAPLAVGVGFASVAGSNIWRSSSSMKRSTPFACLGISTDTRIKEAVKTDKAPAALGPYSQAIKANNFLYVSGVLGLIPETGKFVSDNVEDQTEQDYNEASVNEKCDLFGVLAASGISVALGTPLDTLDLVLKNMGEILKAGGAGYSSVVKTTIMLADLKDFKKVNEIYAKYFPSPAPARSTYQVAALPLDAKIEIECIASL